MVVGGDRAEGWMSGEGRGAAEGVMVGGGGNRAGDGKGLGGGVDPAAEP